MIKFRTMLQNRTDARSTGAVMFIDYRRVQGGMRERGT
jgi:hypothetical protein